MEATLCHGCRQPVDPLVAVRMQRFATAIPGESVLIEQGSPDLYHPDCAPSGSPLYRQV